MLRIPIALLSLPALLLVSACKRGDSTRDTTTSMGAVVPDSAAVVAAVAPTPAGVEVAVATKPGVGVFLTDGNGHALYVLDDASGKAASCTGDCASKYSPVKGKGTSNDSKVDPALIGVITLPDGTTQVTYNGMPLFIYKEDVVPTDTKAQGLTSSGTTAHLVSPAGKKIVK